MAVAFIQLGPYYKRNVTEARRAIGPHRTRSVHSVFMTAPITAPLLEIAIDGQSLYTLGFRVQGATTWWEFEPEPNLPRLAPSQRIKSGPASYSNLGLEAGTSVSIRPWELLHLLANFDGLMGDAAKKRQLLLLIFLVSEALRFESIQDACYAYVVNAPQYFREPDYYYRNPQDMAGHQFDFTPGIVKTVRNWATASATGAFNIGLPHIPSPGA